MPADVACDPVTGRATDAGADLLDGRHQWVGEQHGPGDREPELRACLGVGCDAARVVIGGPRDQAGTENLEKARLGRTDHLDRAVLIGLRHLHAMISSAPLFIQTAGKL